MKKLIVIIVLTNLLLFAQTSKEEKLERIKSRGDINITEEENDVYRLEYPEGRIQYMYLGKSESYQTDSIPTTVIETWNVDTMLYKDIYYFWQEVLVATSSENELVIGDANKNGFPEIYGHSKDYEEPLGQPIEIFEMDSTGIFVNKHKFPDSVRAARGIYDIALDGELKLLTRSNITGNSLFFEREFKDSLPTIIDFVFSLYTGQLNDPKFGDFDKNGITDFLFYDLSPRRTVICEYNQSTNNFDTVTEIPYPTGFSAGYAIGDFDLDGKTDIVYGSLEGEVFVIEAEGEHSYSLVWETDLVGYHTYMQMFTNDNDKNGKPEFWVSSTTHNGVTDITRFTCFEYTSDNEYEEIYRIDFAGVFPIYAENAFSRDVNKDGTEELVICISSYIFIMQFKGSYANPSYEIFYMTRNNLPGGYMGVSMYDLDNDKEDDLLIHRDIIRNDGKSKQCTYIYKPDFAVPVIDDNETVISGYSLEQNYPNPFNPSTRINYTIKKDGLVTLKVYDILGNEVAVLVNERKTSGIHSVEFNASNLPSGIYLYKLTTGRFTDIKKLILLK